MTNDYLEKDNLAGVIILYKPDDSVLVNISSYNASLSHLYIIDNSETPNEELIAIMLNISDNITYHPFGDNLGIATALNYGCNLAQKDGFKWILTMDQDSYFENHSFFESVFNNNYNSVAIIAASYNHIYFKPHTSAYPGLLSVGFAITSGNILNVNAWQLTGGFIDKLFIDEVDTEFCIRAGNKGFKILATKDIYLLHKLGEGLKVKHFLTGNELIVTMHSPLRVYYIVRNNLYLWRKFVFTNFSFVANRVRNLLTQIFKINLYFPEKKTYKRFITKAIGDAFKGKYGKFLK
jgi:rhamnosyltransferase